MSGITSGNLLEGIRQIGHYRTAIAIVVPLLGGALALAASLLTPRGKARGLITGAYMLLACIGASCLIFALIAAFAGEPSERRCEPFDKSGQCNHDRARSRHHRDARAPDRGYSPRFLPRKRLVFWAGAKWCQGCVYNLLILNTVMAMTLPQFQPSTFL